MAKDNSKSAVDVLTSSVTSVKVRPDLFFHMLKEGETSIVNSLPIEFEINVSKAMFKLSRLLSNMPNAGTNVRIVVNANYDIYKAIIRYFDIHPDAKNVTLGAINEALGTSFTSTDFIDALTAELKFQ